MRLRIPSLYIPKSAEQHVRLAEMDDTEIEEYTHHWQTCPACGYVLCSCGSCHNTEQCDEVCQHDLSA